MFHQATRQLQPVEPRHLYVGQQQVDGALVTLAKMQRILTIDGGHHVVSGALQNSLGIAPDHRLIVNHQHRFIFYRWQTRPLLFLMAFPNSNTLGRKSC